MPALEKLGGEAGLVRKLKTHMTGTNSGKSHV